jgi:glycogen debranching enzyme
MTDQTIRVLDGSTFVVSDDKGDIWPARRVPPHGFFSEDTRFISSWQIRVQGQPAEVLSSTQLSYFMAEFFLVVPSPVFHAAPRLGIVRKRLVSDVWLEDLVVVNHCDEPIEVEVEVELETDFADLFEVKDGAVPDRRIEALAGDRELLLRYRNGEFLRETRVTVSEEADVGERGVRLDLSLAPREEHTVSFVIEPRSESHHRGSVARRRRGSFAEQQRELGAELADWIARAPSLESDDDNLRHVYRRSLTDLAALRFYPEDGVQGESLPAAGLPWFMALFGRDSLITSFESLPFCPELAATTLRTLSSLQGTVVDDFRDQEPGKILHEVRQGELTATGRTPHSPYYGSADATPLFLIVLDEYARWTGDTDLVRSLRDNALRALEWIDRHGDLDGDGYIEYETRNPETGLVNQCWKDSWNSILFADGRIATGPIATCEIQGYVYDAKRRTARLAAEVWDDEPMAARLSAEADELRERFLADFWIPERECFALALDGDKRPVDSLCSNMGHLLWSGIVDEDRARPVAAHLMGRRLHSGWGVRTMAAGEAGYNPVEYHNGTVWPHDNALIAAGLRRYGYASEAARLAESIIGAGEFFDHRLPEVFAGCDEQLTHAPVSYPTASSPQAWAAAAPLLLLSTVLGLTPGENGPSCEPHLPPRFGRVALRDLAGRWGRADVEVSPAPSQPHGADSRVPVTVTDARR